MLHGIMVTKQLADCNTLSFQLCGILSIIFLSFRTLGFPKAPKFCRARLPGNKSLMKLKPAREMSASNCVLIKRLNQIGIHNKFSGFKDKFSESVSIGLIEYN